MEKLVQKGDKIKVHYTGKFENGTIFDSSEQSMHQCGSGHGHEHGEGDSCCNTHTEEEKKQEDSSCCGGGGHHHHELAPLEVEVGAGYVIKGFDEALLGMKVGERKSVTITPEMGYGQPMEQMIIKVKMSQFPAEPTPQVGMNLELTGQDGSAIPAIITEIEGEDVTIDANHPLAGRTLIFDLNLVEIL